MDFSPRHMEMQIVPVFSLRKQIYMYVLRASTPAADPLKVTGKRCLVIGGRFKRIGWVLGSPFGVTFGSWGCLGELRGTFGSHGKRLCGPRVVF